MRPHARAIAALLVGLTCCAPVAEPPKTAETSRNRKPDVAETPAIPPQYLVRFRPYGEPEPTRFELGQGRTGLLARGARWVVDARGALVRSVDDAKHFNQARAIEAGAGGYLFAGPTGLFRAATFDGDLEQILSDDTSSVWVGPGFVLASASDGSIRAVDLATKKPFRSLPLGALAVETAPDGTAALIAHGGRAYVSRDRGRTWTDVTHQAGSPIGLVAQDGAVFILDQNGEALRIDAKSSTRTVAPTPAPRTPSDPAWKRPETPLELAASRGALLDDGRAVAIDDGAVVEISMTIGAILKRHQGALPPQAQCTPMSSGSKVLFVCTDRNSSSVFSMPRSGDAVKLEKTFGQRGRFQRGRTDALLFTGPCTDTNNKPGIACVRSGDGQWSELDRSADLSDAPANEPLKVHAWVPKEGGALLVVTGKNGGIWDARTSAKSKLTDEELKALTPLFYEPSSAPDTVADRWGVDEAGNIVGLSREGGFRVSQGGKRVERSPFKFTAAVSAHVHAFVTDAGTKTSWQSNDWGWTFVEVEGAPDLSLTPDVPRSCSEAGCLFSHWVRVGWEPRPASVRPPSKFWPRATSKPPPPLPQLKCGFAGPTKRKIAIQNERRVGFGAETIEDSTALTTYSISVQGSAVWFSENFRAAITGKVVDADPPTAAMLSSTRRIRYIEPFDPAGTVRTSSIKVADLLDASRTFGDFVDPSSEDQGAAIATLSDPPGVLLGASYGTSGPFLWARGKEKPLVLGYHGAQATPISAVQTGPDELTVLAVDVENTSSVRVFGPGRMNEIFSYPRTPDGVAAPPNPDALALSPDGKVSVIRLPTEGPPSEDNPALLFRKDDAPIALAAWSTLDVDGSPVCANMKGHRAILQLRRPWIMPGTTTEAWDRGFPTYARVRWSTTQVCLEAVEVYASTEQLPNHSPMDTAMIARFGKDAGAGQIAVGAGFESREPRICEMFRQN
ncbi:MAG: hypothetical protein HOW73_36475 [Polyangiaceae bacterium]|nr:hypothetical protein [Polyangiaceae bacterium]